MMKSNWIALSCIALSSMTAFAGTTPPKPECSVRERRIDLLSGKTKDTTYTVTLLEIQQSNGATAWTLWDQKLKYVSPAEDLTLSFHLYDDSTTPEVDYRYEITVATQQNQTMNISSGLPVSVFHMTGEKGDQKGVISVDVYAECGK